MTAPVSGGMGVIDVERMISTRIVLGFEGGPERRHGPDLVVEEEEEGFR